jgi:hypothetical protein
MECDSALVFLVSVLDVAGARSWLARAPAIKPISVHIDLARTPLLRTVLPRLKRSLVVRPAPQHRSSVCTF